METEENKHNRVVAYVRKSSEDSEDGVAHKQLNSIEYQRQFVKEAMSKYNVIIERTFEDDKSAYEAFERDGFQNMLDYLKENKGNIDGIVCTEISRLARNFADGGMLLWYMQNGTVRNIYTPTKVFTNSSPDQMMVAIELAMSKKSSDDTGDRTRAAMKSKAHTLKHPARPAVLGYYTTGLVGKKEWIKHPIIGPKIKQVFEQFATGNYTLQEITNYAISIGLKSPLKKSVTGTISKNTWHNRLRDQKYTGIFYHDGERIVGEYEVLISSELFYIVQEVLSGNSHPKTTHLDYAYSGIMTCGICKGPLSGTHKKGITYYRCSKRKLPCKKIERVKYIPEDTLESSLLEALKRIEIDQETWKVCREYVAEVNQPERIKMKKQIRELGERVATEERMRIDIGRKFAEGNLLKTEYDTLTKDSSLKIASLRNTVVKCENISQELDELMYNFLDNVKYVTQRLKIALPENKRELVGIFCENLEWKDGKARWDWKKPYFMLTKHSKNSTMLPRVDSNHEPYS